MFYVFPHHYNVKIFSITAFSAASLLILLCNVVMGRYFSAPSCVGYQPTTLVTGAMYLVAQPMTNLLDMKISCI